jgi:c(7)-type cytochrome triheme protein
MKKVLFLAVLLVPIIGIAFAQTGIKKRRPLPYEYGRVIINNYSKSAHLSPVQFDHWLHRAKFTCRVCHVDIGFAMKAEASDIKAIDNINGYYCGSCHNGVNAFSSCKNDFKQIDERTCNRCHSLGKKVVPKYNFREFVKGWPRGRLGNGVDWVKAETQGKINPVDFIEGISIKRDKFADPKDFELDANAKVKEMPNIIFSHTKHSVWNGCELCHPEIFVGIKKGTSKYSMLDLFEGKYCGVCHINVAFPLLDCQRCHAVRVQ